jgi:predicted PurR-regulated permease PerM
MKQNSFFTLIMLTIIGVSFYLFYRIFIPYVVPLAWAFILTLVAYPVYERINRWMRHRRSLASLVATLLIIFVIVVPGVLMSLFLGKEIVQIYKTFETAVKAGKFAFLIEWREIPWVHDFLNRLDPWLDLSQLNLQALVLEHLEGLSSFALNQSTKFVVGLTQFLFSFLLMAVSMFYLFRDGERFVAWFKGLIPLRAGDKELLFQRIRQMVHATMFGGVLVSLIQGLLGGLAFWILGLPSPVLWGAVMAVLAFIPVVGPFLVWIPAAVLIIIYGQHFVKAGILVAWGIVVVGLSDNFLRPILVSGRTKLHTLILFFAVLGGLKAFGFLGLVAGPLVATVCLAIIDIYASQWKATAANEEG